MTEGQIQGKWFWAQNYEEFKKTEFELAGFNCIFFIIKIFRVDPQYIVQPIPG